MNGFVIPVLAVAFGAAFGTALFLAVRQLSATAIENPTPLFEASALKRQNRSTRVALATANPVVRRAIEITADLADRRGVLGTVERKLRAGDIPVRPAEAILAYLVGALLGAPLPLLLLGPTSLVGIAGSLLVVFGPVVGLDRYVLRRRKRFEMQLPDMLTGLASSLRAGRSVGQSLELLATEQPDPVGRELRKIVAELRLGWPMVDTLDEAADRIGSADFEWAVMAMKIQTEVGGNLAELLDQVADTMRERTRFKGEVKALTAEGRASAMMLVVMPPALVMVMKVMNPTYVEPLFTTGGGKAVVGISAVMLVSGWLAMNKIVKVEV